MAGETTAVNAAKKMRGEIEIGKSTIDIDELLRRKGIICSVRSLPDDIALVLSTTKKSEPILLLDEELDDEKMRFAKAHALGHFSLAKRSGIFVDKKQSLATSLALFTTDETERLANTFAAALLAPPEMAREKIAEAEKNGKNGDDALKAVAGAFAVGIGVVAIALLLGSRKKS